MTPATILGIGAAIIVSIALYGVVTASSLLRRIVALNLLGGGIFLLFGVIARRGAAAGFESDPVPQALVITGIVVAFAGTALAVALVVRLEQARNESPDADGERLDGADAP